MVLDSLAGAEVVQLEQLPDLNFAVLVMGVGAALDPFDRLRKRLALQDPVARYKFLGLREWAVYHPALVAGEPHSSALGTWLQPVAIGLLLPAFFLPLLLKRVYDDKDVQEWIVRSSGLEWTIVRPGLLTNRPATGRYCVLITSKDWRFGAISRADVADFLMRQINDRALIGTTPLLIS
jgi:NAD(P)H-binding